MADLFRQVSTVSLLSGAEVASFGWWILDPVGGAPSNVQADIDAITPHWWDGVRDQYFSNTVFASNVLEYYGEPTTPLVKVQTLPLLMPADPAGSAIGGPLPPQIAVCMSLRSGFAGQSGEGRFYLPGPKRDAVASTGRLDTSVRADLVNTIGAYLRAINTASYVVGVWSSTTSAFTPSNLLQCGDVFDTQRRRRDALIESRASVSL